MQEHGLAHLPAGQLLIFLLKFINLKCKSVSLFFFSGKSAWLQCLCSSPSQFPSAAWLWPPETPGSPITPCPLGTSADNQEKRHPPAQLPFAIFC